MWSYRKPVATQLPLLGRLGLPLLVTMAIAPAYAAQVYVQPTATLTAENDTNLDLTPGSPGNVQGYLANVGALIGIAGPNWDTTISPRLDYRDYPKDSGDNRLEEYLDFRSDYQTQRSSASITGRIDHQDDFNAELTSALYDPFNPVQPTAPQTGKAEIGLTRTSVLLLPRYDYKITPTMDVGVSGTYQSLNYSPSDDIDHIDFNYYSGKGFLTWTISPRTDLQFGGYGVKYEATHVDSAASGGGVSLDSSTAWTQLFSTDVNVVYQHTNFDSAIPAQPILKFTNNTWGATASAVYKAQVSQFRFTIGRIITPSGGGGIYVNDQAQFQYTRTVNQRFSFTGAVVALHNHGLSTETAAYSRDYLQTVLEAKYMIRPTWFVQGGYQYAWQKYATDPDGAVNSRVYVRVGYQGLGRQY